MKTGYIYKITNPNNKIYIGQTINIKNRRNYYKYLKCKSQGKLFNSLSKYGWANHSFEIIEEIFDCESKTKLNEREIFFINYYNSMIDGLNILPGGDLRIFSKESKEKMRQAKLGKKHSKEHNDKIGEKSKNRVMSDESKEKNRIAHLNKKPSNTQCKKHSEFLKGKTKNKIKSITINDKEYKSLSIAAKELNISYSGLFKRLKRHNII